MKRLLGNVLAPHLAQHDVRAHRQAGRRFHDGIPAFAQQRGVSAAPVTSNRTTAASIRMRLVFSMMIDIRWICEAPTRRGPQVVSRNWPGSRWLKVTCARDAQFLVDEKFRPAQYLSPHLIREMRLFSVLDDDMRDALEVSAIQRDEQRVSVRAAGFVAVRRHVHHREPNIQVRVANTKRGDRSSDARVAFSAER